MACENLLTKISDEVWSFVILEKCFKIFDAEDLKELLHEGVLETLDLIQLVLIELGPDLDTVVELDRGVRFGRDESNTVDFLSAIFGLAQEVVDQPLVDFLVGGLGAVDLEDKPGTLGVVGVFPGGLDAVAEVIDGVDLPLFAVNFIAKSGQEYLGQMLRPPCGSSTTKKLAGDW